MKGDQNQTKWPQVLLRRKRANPILTEILVNTTSAYNMKYNAYTIGSTGMIVFIQRVEEGLFRHFAIHQDIEWAVEIIDAKLAEALYGSID